MRRLLSAVAVLALCLSGCATDKSFEKEILGHQAPPSPTDTGWPRAPATPPPPPPPPPSAAPAPRPVTPPPAPSPAPAPVPAGTAPVATPHGPAEEPAAPKLFTPARPAQASPAPAPAASPAKPTTPVHGAQHGSLFTFQVGAFAHAQTANQLMATLQGKGYSVRVEQGTLNKKTFYKVYATKEGTRAALEGELFALGVSEPRLAAERPLGSAAPAGQKAPTSAGHAAAPPAAAPAAQPVPVAAKPAPTATSKPQVRYAPPVVEPAPPLPDGYVPPPPKNKE